jgi:hypothetical protein
MGDVGTFVALFLDPGETTAKLFHWASRIFRIFFIGVMVGLLLFLGDRALPKGHAGHDLPHAPALSLPEVQAWKASQGSGFKV